MGTSSSGPRPTPPPPGPSPLSPTPRTARSGLPTHPDSPTKDWVSRSSPSSLGQAAERASFERTASPASTPPPAEARRPGAAGEGSFGPSSASASASSSPASRDSPSAATFSTRPLRRPPLAQHSRVSSTNSNVCQQGPYAFPAGLTKAALSLEDEGTPWIPDYADSRSPAFRNYSAALSSKVTTPFLPSRPSRGQDPRFRSSPPSVPITSPESPWTA